MREGSILLGVRSDRSLAGRSLLGGARLCGVCLAWALAWIAVSGTASAQRMDLALSRLRIAAADSSPGCPRSFGAGLSRDFCQDDEAWRSLATQFAGTMVPPILLPGHTRGMRGIYVGLESSITGIDSGQDYWARGTEGDDRSAERNRFVDGVLAWNRLNVRKGLPFGFEIGTNMGFLVNTAYWTLGLEVRWSLLEGLRLRNSSVYLPSLSVRGAVQTLIGDSEFNVTVPSVDVMIGERIIVGDTVEISPFVGGQVAFVFADTELVDLTPGPYQADRTGASGTPDGVPEDYSGDAVARCDPNPYPPGHAMGPPIGADPPYCRGDPTDINHDIVFPRLRSTRARMFVGTQVRYEWFALTASFSFDLLAPYELDAEVPDSIPRQWQVNVGTGVSY